MKKNISINIGGIIFHIEEDGYDTLKRYLDSIKKYFSTFDDSSEILADIESRIAEIFLSKLNEGKQVIISEDVNALITTMGSVSDFKAAEAQEYSSVDPEPAPTAGAAQQDTTGTSASDDTSATGNTRSGYTHTAPRQLFRDQKRKVLGGVCAGIGNYFRVDALWVRLLFVILAFATFGTAVLIYVIMWIFVPGSYDLDEAQDKKMFRDPDRKVIGGVCGGVAAYLGIDIVLVRILFVLITLAGFLGGIIYIVLWVIVPEARSLTDRMQMQGEPLTLSNIESTIKKNLAGGDSEEESALTRIILFPFRLLGILLTGLGKIMVPIFELLRVAIGVFIILTGLGFVITTLLAGASLIGISTASAMPWDNQIDMNFPLAAMTKAFPSWLAIVAFITALIPSLFLVLLGVSVISRKMVFNPTVGWSLFALFFVCSILLTVGVSKAIYAFKETGEFKAENTYEPTGKKVRMKVNEVGLDDYNGAHLVLKGHAGKEFRLVQFFEAHGSTRQKAIDNASMITYNMVQQDSSFVFDSNITFKQDAIFRQQEVNMTLYIPYNRPFVMENGFSRFISQYVEYDNRDDHTWIITEKKGLECVDCPAPDESEGEVNEPSVFADENQQEQESDLRDFDELDLRGAFDIRIHRGDEFRVELNASESEKKKYNVYRAGQTLVIEFNGKKNFKWDKIVNDEVRINITMPELKKLEALGSGSIRFDEFTTTDMEIDIKGPIKVRGTLNAEDVILNLNGEAELDITGKANRLNADIEFKSKLKAYTFEVSDAIIEAKGSSTAKVNVTNSLEMEERSQSNIDHRGDPKIITRN